MIDRAPARDLRRVSGTCADARVGLGCRCLAGPECQSWAGCRAAGSAAPATRCRTGCSARPSKSSPVLAGQAGVTILNPGTGEILAEHPLVAPGEASVLDAHDGGPRPITPARTVTPGPRRSGRSARSGLSQSSGCATPPPPATPASARNSPSSPRWRPRTAATRLWRRWDGRSRSAGGGPGGVRAILAAGAGVAQPTHPGRRRSSSCRPRPPGRSPPTSSTT